MAQYRITIGSIDFGLPPEIVSVGWDAILVERKDDESVNYGAELKTDFVLSCRNLPAEWTGDTASDRFDNLLTAEDGCFNFEVLIEVFCAGVWVEVWAGHFESKNWKSDRTKKTITVRPKQDSPLICLKQEWTEAVNMFDVEPVTRTRPTYRNYLFVSDSSAVATPCDAIDLPDVPGFCFLSVTENRVGLLYYCLWIFYQYAQAGTCDGSTPVPPDEYTGWELLSGGCPGTPLFSFCEEGARAVYSFRNGRRLDDIIQFLLDETGCGLTLVSDFLNYNNDDTHPDNSAYTKAAAQYQNLIVHQKSDVKRHDSTEVSRRKVWVMKFQDLISDLKTLFNLEWKIVGADFRLEHVSYFDAEAGADYTAEAYERILEAERGSINRLTRFEYRDQQASDYFRGLPIEIFCGEGETTRRLNLFSNDVPYIVDSDNAESIGDDGWVLIATTPMVEGILVNNYEIILDNRPLSWTELHENFHRYNMAGAGRINGEDTTPLSLKKTRKQPAFQVRHCCGDEYDPAKFITTALGEGIIQESERNLAKETLTLSPLY